MLILDSIQRESAIATWITKMHTQRVLARFACRPVPVVLGYGVQYLIKPLLGFLTVKLFNVPAAFAAGLILTSCVAGAQLSSYASFLSEGDVALSIVLTSLTTITSVAVTPLLTRILIGSVVPVDVVAMASSILQVRYYLSHWYLYPDWHF